MRVSASALLFVLSLSSSSAFRPSTPVSVRAPETSLNSFASSSEEAISSTLSIAAGYYDSTPDATAVAKMMANAMKEVSAVAVSAVSTPEPGIEAPGVFDSLTANLQQFSDNGAIEKTGQQILAGLNGLSESLGDAARSSDWSLLNSLGKQFNIEEYGVYYAAFFLILIIGGINEDSAAAGKNATAAVMPTVSEATAPVANTMSLDQVVKELEKLKKERGTMEKDFAALKSEVQTLQETIKADKANERELQSKLKAAEKAKVRRPVV
jgi:hypothetical protein